MAGFRAHADDPDARFASVEVVKRETDFKTQSVTYSTIGEGWARPVVGLAVQVTFPNTGAPQRPVHDRGTEFRGDATEAPAGEKGVHTFGHRSGRPTRSCSILAHPGAPLVPAQTVEAGWLRTFQNEPDSSLKVETRVQIPLGLRRSDDTKGPIDPSPFGKYPAALPVLPPDQRLEVLPHGELRPTGEVRFSRACTSSESALTLIPSHATEGGDGGGDGDGGD
jgi:hypothetical protein